MAAVPVLMQHVGEIENFDPNGPNSLSQWVMRFEIYCDANGIMAEPTNPEGRYFANPNRRRNLFLTAVGPRAFAILHAATLPAAPNTLPIPMLVDHLRQHFEPEGLVEANKVIFHQRVQQSRETVLEFVSALQALAVNCNFGQYYDQAMKSQLIIGLRHNDMRQSLLTTPNLSWAGAKTLAIQQDQLRTQMRALAQSHAQAQASSVNSVRVNQQSNPGPKHKGKDRANEPPRTANPGSAKDPPGNATQGPKPKFGPCHRCGRRHDVKTCPAIGWECRACHKKGHIADRCPSKRHETVKQVSVQHPSGDDNVDNVVDYLLDLE